jgi:hypothetical protein
MLAETPRSRSVEMTLRQAQVLSLEASHIFVRTCAGSIAGPYVEISQREFEIWVSALEGIDYLPKQVNVQFNGTLLFIN